MSTDPLLLNNLDTIRLRANEAGVPAWSQIARDAMVELTALRAKLAEAQRERDGCARNAIEQMNARHAADERAAGFERKRDQWRGVATGLAELLRKAQRGHDYGSAKADRALADFDKLNEC